MVAARPLVSPPAPAPTGDPLDASTVALARAIRERRLSSEEVLAAHIARIERVNPALNAVIHTRFEEARREARAADARVAAGGDLPPLLGVPCTIKDFFAVTGMPLTAGLVARRDTVSTQDAVLVKRLRDAGAIVMGTTNVPEGGLWMETYNRVHGRTNNPWDVKRTPGGSSGGEGAIIAAGGSPFGLGSDIGGSVRIPAAFCGIVGHKPSGRLLPNTGQWPSPRGEALAYLCPGPMARRVEDLGLLLDVMAGPDAGDEASRAFDLGPRDIDPKELVVYPIEWNGRVRVSEPMRRAVHDATDALVARGARRGDARLPRLAKALEIWGAMLSEAADQSYDEVLTNGQERDSIPVVSELLRWALGRSPHTFPALALSALEPLVAKLDGQRRKFVEEGRTLLAEIESLLGERGVLIHPPYSRPAPRHHDSLRTPFDASCTAIFNVLELPVTVVPVGFDRHGIPVGVQIIGGRGRDHVTLAAARVVERTYGGWVRATPSGTT